MRTPMSRHGTSGFSLLEVLIAVVVLATGLLAMAAMQGKLSTNSADSKARSRIAALLTSVIDDERASGYFGLASFTATACTATTPSALQTAICKAEGDAGLSGLTLTQTVTTYCGVSGATTFAPGACTSTDDAEYKRVLLSAAWKDATGASRSVSATTITSALGLSSATTLIDTPLVATSITPAVHQPNPGLTAGVIPIAVGNGSDTASTNPLPTVDKALTSTTFNTLTYHQGSLDSDISRTIQARVETTVAECVCQGSSSNPLSGNIFLGSTTFRPTFWNGVKYVAPTDAKTAPRSAQQSDMVGNQNDLCTIVCRDHHDASTDTVKYDSVTGDLNRYQATVKKTGGNGNPTLSVSLTLGATTGSPVVASSTDTYLDAARLIRVDGLWRVATDLHAEHMGLLATSPKGFATTSTPDKSSEASYEDFVVDYMGQRLNQILKGGTAPVANTVYASHGLDTPDTIDAVTISNSYRYLHGRGLYLDTLEQPALDKLNSISSNCATGDYPGCLLPYLPFNTINVTQLVNWKALSSAQSTNGQVSVTNSTTSNSATTCDTSNKNNPILIRGCISGASASSGLTNLDQAIATAGKSNSAVAASTEISPYELNVANKLSDAQKFTVTGTATVSEFFVNLTGATTSLGGTTLPFWTDDLSTTNEPTVQWSLALGTANDYCFGNVGRTDTNPNPYDCVTTLPLTSPVSVTVGNYNQVVSQTVSNPCSGGAGTYAQPTLVCYTVSSASVSGVTGYTAAITAPATAVKTTGEQTGITLSGTVSPIPKSQATLNLNFTANGKAAATYTCDAVTAVPTFTVPTTCN